MLYVATITTLANTPELSPLSTFIHVTAGLVYHVEFFFPPGSAGLLHFQLLDGAFPLFPSTPRESLIGDNNLLSYDDMYMKGEPVYTFEARTWNLDTEYDHLLQVRIGMVSKDEYIARFSPLMQGTMVEDLLSKVTAQQEQAKTAQMEAIRSRFAFFGG
jgi:hypothetical protein